MKYVHIIDTNGFFIEDAFTETLTDKTIETPCPTGFYRPRWNRENQQWEEGGTPQEPVPQEPTIEEKITIMASDLESTMNTLLQTEYMVMLLSLGF
jgi:hypothetical protein